MKRNACKYAKLEKCSTLLLPLLTGLWHCVFLKWFSCPQMFNTPGISVELFRRCILNCGTTIPFMLILYKMSKHEDYKVLSKARGSEEHVSTLLDILQLLERLIASRTLCVMSVWI